MAALDPARELPQPRAGGSNDRADVTAPRARLQADAAPRQLR
jgi:hypothetical protein